ncbi:MAG TPA: YggS family pyridoxal phosphate-dependent enzyme [Methylophaga aminisulfidivorans]|nr:YggS family pyridoxal phosphate-dependent enzyme [Methylophaga aminisulfidivorans]
MTEIKKRFQHIDHEIRQAEQQAKRATHSVQLLAVSKTWPAERLREVAELGQQRFGENYLQEALEKITALADLNLEWHFIGPIQSNKTRDIANHFDWVHTIDREKIARRLNEQRPTSLEKLNVCIQLNIDDEASKSGIPIADLMPLAEKIEQMENLHLRGIMIIPAPTENTEQQTTTFRLAQDLFKKLQAIYPQIDTLSMGMTNDMSAAINAGSTMVRIGTALFGSRNVKSQ